MKEQDFEQLMLFPADFPANRTALSGKEMQKKTEGICGRNLFGLCESRSQYVVGENVNGILSTIHECVCADLEKSNYEVWTFCIPACAVGAHHERYRVCILGISKGKPRLQTNSGANSKRTQRKTWSNALRKYWDYLPGAYWAIHKPPICGMVNGIPDWMGDISNTESGCSVTETP